MASRTGSHSKHATPARPPPLTHFLCVPLVTPESKSQLDRSLTRFRSMVTGDDVSPSIDPKAIRPSGTLHLTIGVMSLHDEQLGEATRLLQGLDMKSLLRQVADGGHGSTAVEPRSSGGSSSSGDALTISLRGLKPMHAPQQTSVLYASPEDASDRLYGFCLALKEKFSRFLIDDNRRLRLHATIVNTIYAKGRKQGGRSNNHSKIDARGLLALFDDWAFAESIRLDRVAICEMGAKKIQDREGNIINEEYLEVATADLPS